MTSDPSPAPPATNEQIAVRIGDLLNRTEDKLAHITVNADDIVVAWSEYATRLFGYTPDDALGRTLGSFLVPPEYVAAHEHHIAAWKATPTSDITEKQLRVAGMHKGGWRVPVQVDVQIVFTDSGPRYLGWFTPREDTLDG